MNTSDNYDLKLYEGSDKFNPLTVENVNFESVDEIMYGLDANSIATATELKSGTVHALTRNNPHPRFFSFVATSNYTSGDTFTVDGTQVSALSVSGEALGTGAYVINSTVLCSLVGTVLTVYGVTNVTVADDSNKLGGELPEYYATADDLATVSAVAAGASTIAQAAQTALGGTSFVRCTASEYAAITVKNPNTLYIIVPEA